MNEETGEESKNVPTEQSKAMKETENTNRRMVLKTIGAGVIGGVVLTGSGAAQACDVETTITMQGHKFAPKRASVSLGGENGCAEVEWRNEESGLFEDVAYHDVAVEGPSGQLVHRDFILPGDNYVVTFVEDESGLNVDDGDESKTISSFDGSVALDVHCHTHTAGDEAKGEPLNGLFRNMEGTLTVSR